MAKAEQLESQWRDLCARRDELIRMVKVARGAYEAEVLAVALAEYAAQGITPGCKVKVIKQYSGDAYKIPGVFGFGGVRMTHSGAAASLLVVKKNGEIGKRTANVWGATRLELVEEGAR